MGAREPEGGACAYKECRLRLVCLDERHDQAGQRDLQGQPGKSTSGADIHHPVACTDVLEKDQRVRDELVGGT